MTNEPEWVEEFDSLYEDVLNFAICCEGSSLDCACNRETVLENVKGFIREEKEKSYREGYRAGFFIRLDEKGNEVAGEKVVESIKKQAKAELISKIEEEVENMSGIVFPGGGRHLVLEKNAVISLLSKYKTL